jgi:hypothetical protein
LLVPLPQARGDFDYVFKRQSGPAVGQLTGGLGLQGVIVLCDQIINGCVA